MHMSGCTCTHVHVHIPQCIYQMYLSILFVDGLFSGFVLTKYHCLRILSHSWHTRDSAECTGVVEFLDQKLCTSSTRLHGSPSSLNSHSCFRVPEHGDRLP